MLGAGDIVAGNRISAIYDATAGLFHVTPPVYVPAPGTGRFFTAAAPSGWLAANGAAVSRTVYAALFTAIGTLYGVGDGSTTFNLPNMIGRTGVGVDASSTVLTGATTVGAMLGEAKHALTSAENAAHTHANTLSDPGHTHQLAANVAAIGSGSGSNNFSSSGGTGPTLSATPPRPASPSAMPPRLRHGANNVQPSMAVLICIKT